MDNRTNWSLAVAVSLPVLMVVVVALSIYVPSRFQPFNGQFLYAVQENGYYGVGTGLQVVQGKLRETPLTRPPYAVNASTPTVQLYLHDIASNQSRDITLEQAKILTLDPGPRSASGLQIEFGTQMQGLVPFVIFPSPDYSAVYAKGDRGSLKLNVRTKSGAYFNQFQFIGWVKS